MSTKVAAFVGQRLRQARVARGLTAVALSEQVGVTPQALSQFETKAVEPKPVTLARIAEALSLPESFFLRQAEPESNAPCFFRSLASTTKRARESAVVRLGWVNEIHRFLSEYLELPAPQLPDFSIGPDPTATSIEVAEGAAERLRSFWKMGDGPIGNVVTFLEAKGVCVSRFAFGAEDLDGFSCYAAGRPFIVLNTEKHSSVRSRFDAAHEVAHLVLHCDVPASVVLRSDVHKHMEQQAHRFAGAFLFPAKAFLDEVYSLAIDSLLPVKRRRRVSLQMMIRRALDLDLVSERQYERACVALARKGFRTKEPLDDELPEESPTVLRRGMELVIEQARVPCETVLYRLPYSPVDIEILAQLPRGYLTGEQPGEIVPMRPRVSVVEPGTGTGDVLPFQKK